MFGTLARFARKYRWLILAMWLAASVASFLIAPKLSEVGINDDSQFLPSDTESTIALEIIDNEFYSSPNAPGSSVQIVIQHQPTLTDSDFAIASGLHDWLLSDTGPQDVVSVSSIFDSDILENVLISEDGSVMLMNVGLSSAPLDTSARSAVDDIRRYTATHNHPGDIYVTGQVAISKDLLESITNTIDKTTLVTIALVTILLLIAYRSPVASLIPLVSIGCAYIIARGLVGFLAESGLAVSTLADAYLVVVVFGIGTDYCLFIVSRFREELSRGTKCPIEYSLYRIGPVITASAVTVIIAFLALWTSQFGMTKSVGIALALGVAITLIAGVTLVPALMSIFGKKIFWPVRKVQPPGENSNWRRLAGFITRRPAVLAILIITLLLIPYAALPGMKRSADVIAQMPKDIEAAQGFRVVHSHFQPGELRPLPLVLKANSSLEDPTYVADISSIAQSLSAATGVSRIEYFASPVIPIQRLSEGLLGVVTSIDNGNFQAANLAVFQSLEQTLTSLAIEYPGITLSQPFKGIAGTLPQLDTLLAQISSASSSEIHQLLQQLRPLTAALVNVLGQLSQEFQLQANTPFTDWLYQTYFSTDMSAIRLNIYLDLDPYSDEAVDLVPQLRDDIAAGVNSTSIQAKAYLGGESARYYDTLAITSADFGRVAVLATAGVFIIIVIMLRSLVAPLYMVLTVLFNFGATLGISVFLIQNLIKQGNMMYILPLFVFIMLVAVGADYNIFLMSRIREESATQPLQDAIRQSVANTGGVITTCGIILAGTFSTLILAPLQMVFQVGLAIALGIAVDTFVIRAILVPSLASIFGRANWWPGKRWAVVK